MLSGGRVEPVLGVGGIPMAAGALEFGSITFACHVNMRAMLAGRKPLDMQSQHDAAIDGGRCGLACRCAVRCLEIRCGHLCCRRSEEHTSELQSLMRISYAVF